jgi:hypothetical protein
MSWAILPLLQKHLEHMVPGQPLRRPGIDTGCDRKYSLSILSKSSAEQEGSDEKPH